MIFCFSGTGNSLHLAQKIACKTKDEVIQITESELQLHKQYTLKEDERIGFVFPIYWWGMPKLVERFIKQLEFKNYRQQYCYVAVTYGLVSHNGTIDLRKLLKEKKIPVDANYEVKMIDNYIVGYELKDREHQIATLQLAEKQIDAIVIDILNRENRQIRDIIGTTIKPIVHHAYKSVNHRKKFYVMDTCIGCRKCENECPCNAIIIRDSKPTWNDNCSFCQKCIHSCPKESIQYGKTQGRVRYQFANVYRELEH